MRDETWRTHLDGRDTMAPAPVRERRADHHPCRSVGIHVTPDERRGHHGQRDLPDRNHIDAEREQVMDEDVRGNQHDEESVLGVREVDRKRVSGGSEVDQARPVDVVVGPQPHVPYPKISLTSLSPKRNRAPAPAMKARPMTAMAELV